MASGWNDLALTGLGLWVGAWGAWWQVTGLYLEVDRKLLLGQARGWHVSALGGSREPYLSASPATCQMTQVGHFLPL